ncbi:outer membrane protein assembly factor BamB family protein [Cellulomonas alba]|uniref:PQQ-binding-like beta-propeller repeat protein n=1 Tax=Cellulomonas alba TaxID=3053467 RepID=A0ABT7SGS9_9CELL|nr:PQQ-binding-like beta-propeller repeat protein [Cellulomonas alba]MDM7855403.1 PQQ-binding-like beta-propeller repeat protein [Cellulomonas alba]
MGPNLQAVELEEDGAPPERPPAATDAHRRRWPWFGSALALVGALAVAQHVVDARRTAHLERFDDVPGVVLPLQRTPARLWDLPTDGQVPGEAAGRIVTVRVDGEGVVEGHARATGRADWTTRLPLPDPSDAAASPGLECRPLAGGEGRVGRLACVLSPQDPAVELDRPEDRDVVVLDGTDGSVVARWSMRLQLWGVAGDRIVTASEKGDDAHTWTVTASRADGSRAWSRTLDAWRPHPLPAGGGPAASVDGDADHVLLSADGHAAVLGADGHVLRTVDGDGATGWSLARAGALVRTSFTGRDNGTSTERLEAPGVPPATQPFPLGVDDGSAGDVVLALTPEGLAGIDGASGRRLWTFSQVWLPGVLLDGRLYAQDAADVVALDARTGRVLWRSPVPGGSTGAMFTDGRVLYTPSTDAIETFALDDGARRQRLSLTGLGSVAEGVASDFADLVLYLGAQDGVVTLHSPTDSSSTVVG